LQTCETRGGRLPSATQLNESGADLIKKLTLSSIYLPLLLILCACYSWRPLDGRYDFWAHAAVGRWIWSNGSIPTEGLFIWSAPGFPWVAHSWLSQLFFYGLISLTGPFGVMVFNTLMVCLVFALLWRMWSIRGPISFVTPILFSLAIWVSAPRFQPRQELLTALMLVVLLAYLLAWREGRIGNEVESDRGPAHLEPASCGIVLLFALWINLHALVVLGLVLMVITAATDAVQCDYNRRSRSLVFIAVLCVAATLLNPWGTGYWAAASVLKSGSQAAYVDEWKPFWQSPRLNISYVYAEGFLAVVAIWAWARNPERRWAEFFWVAITAILCIRSRRMLWLLAIVCLVVMASNARSFDMHVLWKGWRKWTKQPVLLDIPAPMRRIAQSGAIVILVVGIASAAEHFVKQSANYWPPRGITLKSPVNAARVVEELQLPGPTFNDYETSSYLQWRFNGIDSKTGKVPTGGLRPLYLDLLNAYPDKILDDYFEMREANENGRKLLDDLGINTVILGDHHRKDKIVAYLNRSPQWRSVYDERDGLVWVRAHPFPAKTITTKSATVKTASTKTPAGTTQSTP
jgi:hypothetical protein